MRRALPLALLLAAACGDAPVTGPQRPPLLAGTIAGAPFTPADATGFLVEPIACGPLGPGLHALAWIQLSSVGGACALAIDHATCAQRPDAVTAWVALARSNALGGAVAPIVPGTYDPGTNGMADADGVVNHFWAGLDRTGPACAPLPVPKEWTVDRLVLDEVGPARLRGSASAHATDGSTLAGSFDVPICAASDAAFCGSLKGGCASTTCVP